MPRVLGGDTCTIFPASRGAAPSTGEEAYTFTPLWFAEVPPRALHFTFLHDGERGATAFPLSRRQRKLPARGQGIQLGLLVGSVIRAQHSAANHQAQKPPVNGLSQRPQFLFARWRCLREGEISLVILAVHTVHEEEVSIDMKIQASTKPMPHVDTAHLRLAPGARLLPTAQRVHRKGSVAAR